MTERESRSVYSCGDRLLGLGPDLDPDAGVLLREPPGSGTGFWAGAPSCVYDTVDQRFVLYYRLRKPRHLGRGGVARLAASSDGVTFEDIWELGKEEIGTESVERGCPVRLDDETFRLYFSYVDPETRRWRIDLIEGRRPEELSLHNRRKVMAPEDIGVEAVKDPFVYRIGPLHYMYFSYVPKPPHHQGPDLHREGDVFVTGGSYGATALAVSSDGYCFDWVGEVLRPGPSWDAYNARGTSVMRAGNVYYMFFDGAATAGDNYEESGGLASSFDLRSWHKIDLRGPRYRSPYGSVRYIEALTREHSTYYYYEWTRDDGSHELRVSVGGEPIGG